MNKFTRWFPTLVFQFQLPVLPLSFLDLDCRFLVEKEVIEAQGAMRDFTNFFSPLALCA